MEIYSNLFVQTSVGDSEQEQTRVMSAETTDREYRINHLHKQQHRILIRFYWFCKWDNVGGEFQNVVQMWCCKTDPIGS